jgi:hypothetical protein
MAAQTVGTSNRDRTAMLAAEVRRCGNRPVRRLGSRRATMSATAPRIHRSAMSGTSHLAQHG